MSTRELRGLTCAPLATALTLLVAGCGAGDSEAGEEGVSNISYSPKPFCDDLDRLKISVTTTGAAREGFQYIVGLGIDGQTLIR